ncbi:MAG: rhomboid family intramembrane serine protease [Planctomycetota bacterium]
MAWEDRDYYRDRPRFGMSGMGGRSVVTWLILINLGVWVLDTILTTASRGGPLISPFYWGNFNVAQAVYGGQVWRFFTYQFLHAGLLHVAFNLIGLFFFGPMVEAWLGSRRFLAFYLLCGACGSVVFTALGFVPGLLPSAGAPLIGASGAVFGVLAAAAVIAPRQEVLFMFIIKMQIRTMVLIFLGIAVLSVILGSQNAGGEAAHLGGAVLGFVLIRNAGWLNWADGFSAPDLKGAIDQHRRESVAKREAATEAEIDRILAKVSEHGLHSLTAKEKRILSSETERRNKAG